MYAGLLTHQRMAYVDLFQPPMKGPFEIPNPRVCFTGDKVEPDDWEGRGGGRGLNKVRLSLTAPLTEGLRGPTGPAEGPAWSTPECTAPWGGGHGRAGAPEDSLPLPTSLSLRWADPSSRRLIPRYRNRTQQQAVTRARRSTPLTASEMSAARVPKPRHPPRPRGEHREPSPACLPSPLGAPRIPPEAS